MIAHTHYTPFKLRNPSQLNDLTQLLNGPLVNGTHTVTEQDGLVTITSHYDPASQKPGAVRAPEDVISMFIAERAYVTGVTVMQVGDTETTVISVVRRNEFAIIEPCHFERLWESTLPLSTAPRDSAAYQSR